MTDIEQKALALLGEVSPYKCEKVDHAHHAYLCAALRLSVEQHEAFRQEVSDVASVCAQHFCKNSWTVGDRQDHVDMLSRFIIPAPKPDPLEDVLEDICIAPHYAKIIRAALGALDFEIREKGQ